MASTLALPTTSPVGATASGASAETPSQDQAALDQLRRTSGREHPHILLPIDNAARANWCLAFVLACHRAGWRGEVSLVHVVQNTPAPAVVRERRQANEEDGAEQFGRGELRTAAAGLSEAGIKVRTALRSGSVVFAILDAAEQLACDVVVVPRARQRMFGVASRGVVYRLERSTRNVPLLTIDRDGRPSRSAGTP